MIEACDLTPTRLAILLVMEDRDVDPAAVTEMDCDPMIDDVCERSGDAHGAFDVHYTAMPSDETGAFPGGEILANVELAPCENDDYRNGMVVAFRGLVRDHDVLIEADHGGMNASDQHHEAWTNAVVRIVPKAEAPAVLARMMATHRDEVVSDTVDKLDGVLRRLAGMDRRELATPHLRDRLGVMMRLLAGTA